MNSYYGFIGYYESEDEPLIGEPISQEWLSAGVLEDEDDE